MSDKRFTTDELIDLLECGGEFSKQEIDAIIARLRAADALLDAARGVVDFIAGYTSLEGDLRKAIADYENPPSFKGRTPDLQSENPSSTLGGGTNKAPGNSGT